MAYETKDNTCTLHKNKFKEKEGQPDYRGDAKIDGRDRKVSGWINVDKNGAKYLKLSFEVKQDDPARADPQQSISQRATETIKRPDPISSGRAPLQKQNIIPDDDDMNDAIPF